MLSERLLLKYDFSQIFLEPLNSIYNFFIAFSKFFANFLKILVTPQTTERKFGLKKTDNASSSGEYSFYWEQGLRSVVHPFFKAGDGRLYFFCRTRPHFLKN